MAKRICSIEDCDGPYYALGWCEKHYARNRRSGDPLANLTNRGVPAPERFWLQVNKTETCWLWTGHHNRYGTFHVGYRDDGSRHVVMAHRYAYEILVGPIPDRLTLDHVKARGCTSTLCVRPDHLEPVTVRENLLRGDTFQAANAAKTHCPQGHPYDEANTYVRPSDGGRRCRACQREAGRRYREANLEQVNAKQREKARQRRQEARDRST